MSDYKVIYLQPACCADPEIGQLWCEDEQEECEDGNKWTKYVRADLFKQQAKEIERQAKEIKLLKKGIAAVENLMESSSGVYGLHLNGDVAPWGSLRTGSYFEAWLWDFDNALATPAEEKE